MSCTSKPAMSSCPTSKPAFVTAISVTGGVDLGRATVTGNIILFLDICLLQVLGCFRQVYG